jgi:hypothetical protein
MIMNISKSFICIIILFGIAFKYSNGLKLTCYAGAYTDQLCVELCNFVQGHIFVKYLTH